jgi:hypothetical protein
MTKSIIFNLLVFVLFFCTTVSKAQTVELVTPSSKEITMKIGEAPQALSLRYTNTGSTSSAPTTIRISVPATQKGIYIYSETSLPAGLTATEDVNKSYIDFNVPSLPATGTILLPLKIQGGYCFEFSNGTNQVILPNLLLGVTGTNLKLTVNQSTSLSQVFSQNKVYRNGDPTPVSVGSLMTVEANLNDVIVREYVYQNSSATDSYTGLAQLDGPNITQPVNVTNLKVFTSDANDQNRVEVTGATKDLTNWLISVPVLVPANGRLIFQETVVVNGCLTGAFTNIDLYIGVGTWDNCGNTKVTLGPNLNPIKGISFAIDRENSNFMPDLKCITNGISSHHKNLIYNYTGTATALNNTFSLFKIDREAYVVTKNSVKLSITRNGVKNTYAIDWSANDILVGQPMDRMLTWNDFVALYPAVLTNPDMQAELEYYCFHATHVNSSSVYYIQSVLTGRNSYERADANALHPFLLNFFVTYGDFLQNNGYTSYGANAPFYYPFVESNLPQGLNTEMVLNAQISHYFDNGVSTSITMNPGDKVELEWDEYTSCLNQYRPLSTFGFWPYTHSEDACQNITYNGYGQFGYFGGSQAVIQDPGNSNISGENDRCTLTQDGQIENVSFKLTPNLGQGEPINDLTGKLVFKVYLDDGLDMDASFATPAALGLTKRGYDDLTTPSTCDQTCDPACSPNRVLTQPVFNVKYTLANGTVIDLSNHVQLVTAHNDPAAGNQLNYLKSPGYNAVPSVAYYLYTVEMDLALLNITAPANADKTALLNVALKDGRFTFDVRCYCPASNPSGKAGIQVVTLFDKCENRAATQSCDATYFTNLWALGYTQFGYQINCPGCKIPGSNIGASSFLRQNVGLVDVNKNGFPDDGNALNPQNGEIPVPANDIVRRSGSEGDIMKAKFMVDMSDGSAKSEGQGFLKPELEADGVILDNLIVKVTIASSTTTYQNGTAKVTYHGTDYFVTDYTLVGNTAYFRIPASLIHSESMLSNGTWVSSFNTADPLIFEADFRLTNLQADNSNIEVVYQAGFTPCENCTQYYAVSPAFSNTGDYDAVLANKEKLFLMCTDGGTYFKGIPFRSERNLSSSNKFNTVINHGNETGSNCKKTLGVRNWGEFGYTNNFGYANMYETECRYFFDETKPFRSELTLPAGYVIDRIEVTGNASQAGYRYNETYTIQASEIANYTDPDKNGFWTSTTASGNDVIGFNIFYKHESESDAATYIPQGNNNFSKDVTSNVLPAFLIVKDEQWFSHVYVILKPKTNCTPSAQVQVYPENHYLKNVPTYPSNDPTILSDPNRALTFSYDNPFGHTGPLVTLPDGTIKAYFDGVNSQLELKNITDQALTVNGNVLDLRINLKELTSTFQADYPFLVLEGPALTPSKGLEFDGIYWSGAKAINYPVYYDKPNNRILIGLNYADGSYIDGSKSYSFPAIPKGSSGDYTIRFNYSCTSITDQGCGGNPVVTNGLNNDELTIRPGYACSYTPTFAQYDQALYCGIFEPISYRLSSQVYGSNVKPSFVVQGNTIESPAPATLASCENFKYNLTLGSCQEGPVKGFKVVFATLPVGLSISGVSILQNNNFTVVQDIANPLAYLISTTDPANYISIANNNPIVVSFDMAISCLFATADLQATVNGIATCGGNLSSNAFVHHLIAAPAAFDNVVTSLQCTASSIALNYTSSAATTHSNTIVLTLPNGLQFADDATSTRTISIPVGTSGSNNFTYPINVITVGNGTIKATLNQNLTVQCTTEEPCTRTKTTETECTLDYCAITALAGPDQAGCSGLSYTLSMANVQPGFTYTWTGGGQSYLGSTVQVSPAVTTTYTLTVRSTANVNCAPTTDDVTISILNPSVTLVGADHVCPQSSGTLTAQLSGSSGSDLQFTWYKIINGSPQVLEGPGNHSTYSYTGLTETTLFEVKVTTTTGTCTASANLTVNVYALPILTITAPAEFCMGSAPAVITATPAGGYFQGTGVTLTSGIYTFNATTAGNYTVTYYYTDPVTGCSTFKQAMIVVNPCCKYALKTTEVMCGEDAIRCITLQAVKPVDNGIKGMDFILRYDRTLMTPTGLPGRGNATLGNVVLNGGMTGGMGSYAMTQRTITGTNFNELSVSIFYTGQAPAAADFDGIGDVICIEFKILGSATSGLGGTTKSIWIGDFYQAAFSQGVVDDEHKLFMIRSCVENNGVGIISILKNNFLNGKVYYHNDINAPLKYDAATTPKPYLVTTITPVTTGFGSPLCTPSSVASKTTDINGAYSIDLTGANGVKVSRDIVGDYYNSCTNPSDVIDPTGNVYNPASLLMAINGYDAYLMESITTMRNPVDVVYVADRKVPGVIIPITATAAFPTAFQMIASDVNMDRMVRAVDISLVQERAVSKLCEYPQVWNYNLGVDPTVYPLNTADQRSLDWRFIDKSQVSSNLTYTKSAKYPLPAGVTGTAAAYYWRDNVPNPPRCLMGPSANPNTCKSYANSFDIHAIMLGDIDGSWRANLNGSQKNLRTVSDRQVVINLTNKQRKGINTYRVPVTFISQDPATVALDFALDYNEEELRIIGVGNLEGGDLAEAEVVYNDFESKQLLFTSYTMTGFNSSKSIYYIDFVSKNGDFNANMLGSGDAYLNGERVELVVEGSTITGIENPLSGSQYGFELVPNPAAHEGEILYNVKAGSHAKIVVYNTLGQVITEYKDLEGQGSIQVGTSDWSSGMYQVILFTENSQKLIKKWVIQN